MSKPLVTIAIPTFNRADKYLKETLECAINQTYENLEILVSDNCSTDHTPELIQSYTDPRLNYYRQKKNLGQRGNMNFLVEKASGDYFLMFHDDDQIDLDFIETCMKAVKYRTGVGLIVTGSSVIDAEGNVLRSKENHADGMKTEELILFWYRKKIQLFFCCSLFGTHALRKAGGFEDKYNRYDDVAAEFKCSSSDGRVDIKEPKAYFREHLGSGTTASDLKSWCDSALALLELSVELASENKDKIRTIGLKTSADRIYRYAKESDSIMNRWIGCWNVFKYFNHLNLSKKKNISSLIYS
jgi:glycosyltransferase involved in cell wall biosynthesis